jgi:hypothetical protein
MNSLQYFLCPTGVIIESYETPPPSKKKKKRRNKNTQHNNTSLTNNSRSPSGSEVFERDPTGYYWIGCREVQRNGIDTVKSSNNKQLQELEMGTGQQFHSNSQQ